MVLESNLKSVSVIESLLSKAKAKYDISEEKSDRIWIALNEALSNAIQHGNKFNPDKKVKLSVRKKKGRFLCFIIKDEGNGFDPTKVPDPTSADRIEEPNGRGVFLIKKLADIVKYSKNGTCLEIGFDLLKNYITLNKKVIYPR